MKILPCFLDVNDSSYPVLEFHKYIIVVISTISDLHLHHIGSSHDKVLSVLLYLLMKVPDIQYSIISS